MKDNLKPLYPILTGRGYYEAADRDNPHRKEWKDLTQHSRGLFEQAAANLRSEHFLCCECGVQSPPLVNGICKLCRVLSPCELEIYAMLIEYEAMPDRDKMISAMKKRATDAGYNFVWQTTDEGGRYVLEKMTAQEKLEYDAAQIAVQIEQELGLQESAPLHYEQLYSAFTSNPITEVATGEKLAGQLLEMDETARRLGWQFQMEDARVVLVPREEQ